MTKVGISVSEIQKITGCHYQQGVELYNRILERDNDKLDQLEQVARDMLQDMREAENWLDYFADKDSDELYMIGAAIQSAEGRLIALGVNLDD